MSRNLRNLLLTVHVTTSVGFLGTVATFLALAIAGASLSEPQVVRAAYIAMDVVTTSVIVPLCFAGLLTGVFQSLSTPWGLFRHYWVIVKLLLMLLSAAVLLLHTQPIRAMAELAMVAQLAPADYVGQRVQLIVASAGALGIGLIATVLSIYKPRGLTRYGWRKQHSDSGSRAIS